MMPPAASERIVVRGKSSSAIVQVWTSSGINGAIGGCGSEAWLTGGTRGATFLARSFALCASRRSYYVEHEYSKENLTKLRTREVAILCALLASGVSSVGGGGALSLRAAVFFYTAGK